MTTSKTGLNIQVVLLRARSSREGMSFSGNLIKLMGVVLKVMHTGKINVSIPVK